ncbi:hypothetical protein F2P56_003984 [Juglans regia]|uniref:CCT domain-containing protein n=2 Tax=Juglans regia TaxID=51240 RepID=A0A833Y7C2_JUGRE|nr:putative zinc finger protein CONSTANS-LIKE 11 [Juglans regia]KAF5477334.1 hypothetical protein F2P56_003984 [Juglans regia]
MASIPQFYSDCTFPSDLSDFSTTAPFLAGVSGTTTDTIYCGPMWSSQESIINPVFDQKGFPDDVLSQSNISSSDVMSSFPGQLDQTSELAIPTLFDSKMDLCGHLVGIDQNFGVGYQLPDVMCSFGDECCGFSDDYGLSVYPAARENRGSLIQGNQHAIDQESNIKVGRYSKEEKKERILRYLHKRNQRNFNKTIKYACRKTLADRRVRVRGRFARNRKLGEEERAMKNTNNSYIDDQELCYSDAIQIKADHEDDWLQEALSSLIYLPYVTGSQFDS